MNIISKSFKQSWVLCFLLLFFVNLAFAQKQDTSFQCELVEEMPEFPGGTAVLLKYISVNLKYPEMSSKDMPVKVIVKFTINKNGKISNVNIAKSTNYPDCETAAIELIKHMPPWKPGKLKGKIIACQYMLPITFQY